VVRRRVFATRFLINPDASSSTDSSQSSSEQDDTGQDDSQQEEELSLEPLPLPSHPSPTPAASLSGPQAMQDDTSATGPSPSPPPAAQDDLSKATVSPALRQLALDGAPKRASDEARSPAGSQEEGGVNKKQRVCDTEGAGRESTDGRVASSSAETQAASSADSRVESARGASSLDEELKALDEGDPCERCVEADQQQEATDPTWLHPVLSSCYRYAIPAFGGWRHRIFRRRKKESQTDTSADADADHQQGADQLAIVPVDGGQQGITPSVDREHEQDQGSSGIEMQVEMEGALGGEREGQGQEHGQQQDRGSSSEEGQRSPVRPGICRTTLRFIELSSRVRGGDGDGQGWGDEASGDEGEDEDETEEDEESPTDPEGPSWLSTLDDVDWRPRGRAVRFSGHCNSRTDIKECAFWGDKALLSGSDDGAILVWSTADGSLLTVLKGHSDVVNCVQVHPRTCMLASAGIDHYVQIWRPTSPAPFHISGDGLEQLVRGNQELMDRESMQTLHLRDLSPHVLQHLVAAATRRGSEGGGEGETVGIRTLECTIQ